MAKEVSQPMDCAWPWALVHAKRGVGLSAAHRRESTGPREEGGYAVGLQGAVMCEARPG